MKNLTQIETIIDKFETDAMTLNHHFCCVKNSKYLCNQIDAYAANRPDCADLLLLHLSIHFDMLKTSDVNLAFIFAAIANHCELKTNN